MRGDVTQTGNSILNNECYRRYYKNCSSFQDTFIMSPPQDVLTQGYFWLTRQLEPRLGCTIPCFKYISKLRLCVCTNYLQCSMKSKKFCLQRAGRCWSLALMRHEGKQAKRTRGGALTSLLRPITTRMYIHPGEHFANVKASVKLYAPLNEVRRYLSCSQIRSVKESYSGRSSTLNISFKNLEQRIPVQLHVRLNNYCNM